MFSWYTTPVNDIDRGNTALQYFHNASLSFPGYPHSSLDSLAKSVGRGQSDIFLDSLGFAVNQIDMRESQVRDAMQDLARRSQGRVPTQSSFFKSLSDRTSALTFTDYVYGAPEIGKGIAKDAVNVAVQVGESAKFFMSPTGILVALAVVAVVGLGYLKVNRVI